MKEKKANFKKDLFKGVVCKESNRKNNGITLIALVITIIVLIILATVAIQLSLGENGIFNRAKTATQEYENAQDYEEMAISDLEWQVDVNSRDTITIPQSEYQRLLKSSNSNNYSTDEQVIGTWINDKTLYQKTIEINSLTAGNNDISLPDVEEIISTEGFGYGSDGWRGFFDSGQQTSTYQMCTYFNPANKVLRVYVGSGRTTKAVIIIKYTKTDTATN